MIKIIGSGARTCAASLGLLGLCALAAAELPVPYDSPAKAAEAVQTPEGMIQNWPGRSRSTARALIAKYGEPSRFGDNDLVWFKNGPWRKTVVYRTSPLGFMHGKDIVEQSIGYAVPEGKIAALKSFDSRIRYDKANKELSSRAENESLNFLALNLADEIVNDKRNADEARDFYRKTTKLSESGKTSAYTDGFLFPLSVDNSSTLNPEENPSVEPMPTEPPYESGMPERVVKPMPY
ncbi:MAG: hypothetical protein ACHQ2Z_16710 [Elusimicrobiota bacterium]